MSYEFSPVKTDDKAIKEIAGLLRFVFPEAKKYSEAFLKWQYKDNPDGTVVGYNAYQNGVLVAHYATIPMKAILFGKEERGVLSLNTATHPDHQGKKLFTSLAGLTYTLAAEKGFGFVAGVANANSTPGFINKLGFQLVGALEAKLGFGKISVSESDREVQFLKQWNKEMLDWKLKNPAIKYKIKDGLIYAPTDKTGIEAMLLETKAFSVKDNAINLGFRPITLWIGINAAINWSKAMYFNVPKRMRPSPLNFIFKDLTKLNRKLEYKKVIFNAFDFDAY
ncbi:MAG: GNAT family N-acetyltransferase [Bacteroidetes bacterium]|nr:GNAT family N-acetyltransferase [Bacteroidota bacterium]